MAQKSHFFNFAQVIIYRKQYFINYTHLTGLSFISCKTHLTGNLRSFVQRL